MRRAPTSTLPNLQTTMGSIAYQKSKQSGRTTTKELLAVAGLTAAEFSSSYAVQEYLGKTIQNASQKPPGQDIRKRATKLHKPHKEEQLASKRPLATHQYHQHRQVNYRKAQQQSAVVPTAEGDGQKLAMFVHLQATNNQPQRKVDRSKLGQQHEALGSHPPFILDKCDFGTSAVSDMLDFGWSTDSEGRAPTS